MLKSDMPAEIEHLFSKQFQYRKTSEWRLPSASDVFSSEHEELSNFISLKDSLNKTKNLLSDKKLDDWHRHTAFTNIAGRVVPEVRRSANAELCTQAWCKFHEIVWKYPLLPDNALWNRELNTIHLCEAPGAFISSLNHYLKTQDVFCDWNWVANTLNPYHEANDGLVMIADDRLIANTLPWWYFGPDNTGDLMTIKYLDGLQQFISNMSVVHLVTADGSFDCQGDPGEQESLVSPLHYCEVVTCLLTLGKGGSFVLKMFTLFQHSSINLMYLLNCCFNEVHIIKPGTSKAGNSEVYVVCLDYFGKEVIQDIQPKLIHNFGTGIAKKSLFSQRCLPESFLLCHLECCTFFNKHQTETILENLHLFSDMGEEQKKKLNTLRNVAVTYYRQMCDLRRIERKHWLVKNPRAGCSLNPSWMGIRNRRTDTYNERKQLEALTWTEKVAQGFFNPWLKDHVQSNRSVGSFLEYPYCDLNPDNWCFLQGNPLPRIKSSPFCENELLKALNETIAEFFKGTVTNILALPPCSSCCVLDIEYFASVVLSMMDGDQHIFICGAHSLYTFLNERQRSCSFLEMPMSHENISLLHDGEPVYEQQLITLVVCALQKLKKGFTST
ncbi:cap-specific mRNA (nucleoside-2'-O-)-methyltransferase 2 isoform X2 [Xenopus laevis]|uniref:Cap-specific mRNA (nucleoside-2'-O-)-methyltransferase 2 n=1 Tax=Xenopus laevis TaxID=8355 RepID=A0A8J0V0N2_XENLA|nr:cap-specific mRNA (nucleoside-2'-O-)-methyltransferase 2 isoform X2 [Xenopus laevis]